MNTLLESINSAWDHILAFWHAFPPEVKGPVITAVGTIIAATIGAYVVFCQIGRQARNAINQNQHNEALKLKLEVYKDIIGISRKASDAISDLSAFISKFQSYLSLARQTQTERNAYAVPSAHPSQFIDKESQVHSSAKGVITVIEAWQIIDPKIDIFRTAINTALYDINAASHPYFDAAYHAMAINAPVNSWKPPSAEDFRSLKRLETLSSTL